MNTNSPVYKLLDYFNLEHELDDYESIHAAISKDVVFRGTNLWILMIAIVVASVGLNMNSTAVIIGAMLISPLMGPINGMGYAISVYDFELFRKALKHFGFAVAMSLVASTTYFTLSPISTAYSELLARTSPTIYDVLIALFGGLAGIIAIATKSRGNVVPGVAIATALMPPLCTAGYGLASGQWEFFLGAFFLFTINTVFIALASVAVSQFLKFPIRTIVDGERRKRVNQLITAVIVLISIPSIYFGYRLVQKETFTQNYLRFVKTVELFEGSYLIRNEVEPENRRILLVYGGIGLPQTQKDRILEIAADFGLKNAKIDIQEGLMFDALNKRVAEAEQLRAELNRSRNAVNTLEIRIKADSLRRMEGRALLNELRVFFPEVHAVSLAPAIRFYSGNDEPEQASIVELTVDSLWYQKFDRDKIRTWLQTRLGTKKVSVFVVPDSNR